MELAPADFRRALGQFPTGVVAITAYDEREGVTTGVSAADRARTIRIAADPSSAPETLVNGGHVSALRARPGGLLERAGYAEASLDLARLAGCTPAGVLCEIMNGDGTMARVSDLATYCQRHELMMISISDVITYRLHRDQLVTPVVTTRLPTRFGNFRAVGYESLLDHGQHIALVIGNVAGQKDVLVYVHSQCVTGDVFQSIICDCGQRVDNALETIARESLGVVVYLTQEAHGLGLLRSLSESAIGTDADGPARSPSWLTGRVDLWEYGIGAQILRDLGLSSIRLLTDGSEPIQVLQGFGLRVTDYVPFRSAARDSLSRNASGRACA